MLKFKFDLIPVGACQSDGFCPDQFNTILRSPAYKDRMDRRKFLSYSWPRLRSPEIDYPEVHQGVRGGGGVGAGGNVRIPGMDRGVNIVFDDAFPVRPELFQKSNRSSHSSDTSSAYSGSDTMTSVHSSVEADEVDLSGLIESVVDSDEEDLGESNDSLIVKDRVRECLEKDPSERTDDDIEQLLDFTQHLKAFTNMTLAVRKALCGVMVFAVVEKAGTIVMNDGEELDSWSVVINGCVEVELSDGRSQMLQVGDSEPPPPQAATVAVLPDELPVKCVEKGSKAEDVGLKRGDQILEVNGQSFQHVSHARALEIFRGTTHLSITVKSNLLEFKQMLAAPDDASPSSNRSRLSRHNKMGSSADPRARSEALTIPPPPPPPPPPVTPSKTSHSFMTLRPKLQKALMKMNILPKNTITDVCDDSSLPLHSGGGQPASLFPHSHSNPDLMTICYPDLRTDYPEHVLKVYKSDQTCKYLLVHEETTAHEVVMLALQEFGITEPSSHFYVILHFQETTAHEVVMLALQEFGITEPSSHFYVILHFQETTAHEVVMLALQEFGITEPSSHFYVILHFQETTAHEVVMLALQEFGITEPNSHFHVILHFQETTAHEVVMLALQEFGITEPSSHFYVILHFQETTAHEVVMLALQEFGITEPSSHFSLCEVSVADGGFIKQRRLPDPLQNLAERIGLSSRYYLKTNDSTETLVGDELAAELLRESQVHFLQLNAVEVATQLTLQDYAIFRQIEATEYVDDLFELKSGYGVPMLSQFAELVNREMFWVVTEVCSESNLVRRSKVIKQFIKVARQCKECRNFNSMFAIVSGLGHGAVSRLRSSWEKLPSKYQRLFQDLQDLMDPSRNMSKYRQLVSAEQSRPPIIPFYPVVKKDLTFIHLGNDSKVEGLINFEKLRMIAKEVRTLTNMCSAPYDLLTMLELGGQPPSNAMVTLNQLTTGGTAGQMNAATVKRRKKSTGAPNPKKMFEEAQMVRRVKAYLARMNVITDEDKLHALSAECEGTTQAPGSGPLRKRHPSPTLSTASTASSASEGRKPNVQKFGSASPQAVRKLLSLSEPVTAPLLSSVDLNAESSSVTSLSNLPLRKTVTSGSVTSTDSGHSTQLDSHSNSSGEVPTGTSPPLTHRRHSMQPPGYSSGRPPFPHAVQVLPPTGQGMAPPPPRSRPPPSYSVAAQMAARINLQRLGRAHSHEGVTSSSTGALGQGGLGTTYCPRHTGDEDDEDDDAQVSAV
ncbi:hypothetical protein M8J76_012242 [Diaphorina citri]|nr:hypothetical protein M8J76_012242 [Diaphorina citri]